MNGNWIIPTIEQVKENSGKWEITSMPTLSGEEGYASNGGSSLYITSNCKNLDLAKDFLAKTFGAGSTETYDAALKNGGVITCSTKAGQSSVYQEGVEYFNNQPIYSKIVEMGTKLKQFILLPLKLYILILLVRIRGAKAPRIFHRKRLPDETP